MKRWLTNTALLFLMLPVLADAQNFSKVIEIVGGLEESVKGLIAKEEQSRKSDIAALRSDIGALRTALFHEDTVNSAHLLIASTDAQNVMDRLEVLERRTTASVPASDILAVTEQLDRLVDELKNVIEEGRKDQKNRSVVPAPLYTITGQIRHRGELDGRTFVPDARTLGYNLLRSRFTVSIAPAAETKIVLQVQDSRTFGGGNSTLNRGVQDGMSKSIDFHQAYFSLSNLFDLPLSVKLGRQEMVYGKGRLISVAGWNNVGNAFDAVSAQTTTGPVSVDAFYAKLVGSTTSVFSENIAGLYGLWKITGPYTADAFLFFDNNSTPIAKGIDKGKARLGRYSSGITLTAKPAPFDADAELILQRGSIALTDSSPVAGISGYLYAVTAGYLVLPEQKLRIGAKFQVMSGDDNVKSGKNTAYATLFSSAHSYFGYMDFFPKYSTEYGVRGISLHSGMDLSSSVSATMDLYHYLFDAVPTLKTASGAVVRSQALGYEWDLTSTYRYSSLVTLNGGVSAFLPQTAMIALKGPSVSYWGYLMTTVTF